MDLNEKYFNGLTDEEIEFLTSREDFVSDMKAYSEEVEVIKADNPKFQGKTLKQLSENNDFILALREHRSKYPSALDESDIESLISKIPTTFSITNNKLSNEMTKDFVNRKDISLAVINVGKKNEVRTYNSLTYDDKNISITGQQEFTAYDRAIHNAVCSLYASGNDVVTPAMVYRAATGMTETEKVSEQATEAVKNSLDKSRFMRLKVDFTEEAKARGWNVDETEIDSNLLEARVVTVRTGGNKVNAYKILATPVLYQYWIVKGYLHKKDKVLFLNSVGDR
jgi:hypothetical protein